MCSFTITNKKINLNNTNFLSQKRGPDLTNTFEENGISFLHNLLHLTGDKTKQPFYQDDIVCVFNGEIYNYKSLGNYNTDGECLIPMYKEFGFEFAKQLDGEFSICIIDFKKSRLMLFNDTFATKPLWFAGQENDWGVASYESSLKLAGFDLAKSGVFELIIHSLIFLFIVAFFNKKAMRQFFWIIFLLRVNYILKDWKIINE